MPDVDFDGADWIGCHSDNFIPGRNDVQEFATAAHIMQGTLPSTDSWFKTGGHQSSAHFGIGYDAGGKLAVHQYVRIFDEAFANGILIKPNTAAVPWLANPDYPGRVWRGKNGRSNANYATISIEHAGKHPLLVGGKLLVAWQMPTDMYFLSLDLHRHLFNLIGVAPARDVCTRHSDYNSFMGDGGKGWCPGPGFPMANLLGDLGDPNFAAFKNKIVSSRRAFRLGWSSKPAA